MKKILEWFVTIFFVTSMIMLIIMVTSCNPNVPIDTKTGAIKGQVKYLNENITDYSGIQVTLSSTNGLMAIDFSNSRGITTNTRSVTNYCTTDVNGNYTFEDVPEGVYTIYASSNSSTKKAVATNVVVKAAETVTAEVLGLTATGAIKGKVTVNGKTENVLGLDVFIAGTSYVAKVGSDGSYEITDIPAKVGYMLCVQKGEQTFPIDTNIEVKANESVEIDTYNVTYTSTGGTSDSFTWKGSFAEAPENPETYWAYLNTKDGCSYIYNGTDWELFAQGNTNVATNQIKWSAKEEGIDFEIYFPEEWLCLSEETSCQSMVTITDTKNNVTMYKAITSLPDYDYSPFHVVYPLVEAGKEYTFEVAIKNSNVEFDKRKVTVKAIGGLGEYKVENIDKTELYLSEDKILSRTLQEFTDNPNVTIISYGTYYTLTAVNKDAEYVWDACGGSGADVWIAGFWGDSVTQDCDLKRVNEYKGFEWGSYDSIANRLVGGKLGVCSETRVKIAGYTYNDTAYFSLDYIEQMFDWDDEEPNKVFVMYGFRRDINGEPYFFKDIPGVEKYYMIETEEYGQTIFTKTKTENAVEVYGKYMESGQRITEPVYIPTLPEDKIDTSYYSDFTGKWLAYYSNSSSELPLNVSSLIHSPYIFLEPDIPLLKATANFYDEDGNLIDSETREYNKYDYYWNRIYLPSLPEKEGYFELYWEDDSRNIYYLDSEYNSRYVTLTNPVTNFTAVYIEAPAGVVLLENLTLGWSGQDTIGNNMADIKVGDKVYFTLTAKGKQECQFIKYGWAGGLGKDVITIYDAETDADVTNYAAGEEENAPADRPAVSLEDTTKTFYFVVTDAFIELKDVATVVGSATIVKMWY